MGDEFFKALHEHMPTHSICTSTKRSAKMMIPEGDRDRCQLQDDLLTAGTEEGIMSNLM